MTEFIDRTTIESRYLGFTLGGEEYAIPLLAVKEVIAMPEVTPIPQTPTYFLGIMNLRGQVISVVDLRHKFNIKPAQTQETAVVICELQNIRLGVVVDSINSVLTPSPDEISEKPEIASKVNTDYITGVYRKDDHLVLFLDISLALSLDDHKVIANSVPQRKIA